MSAGAGAFEQFVTILRRPAGDRGAGVTRGAFAPVEGLIDVRAQVIEPRPPKPTLEAGFPSDGLPTVVRLRACAAARSITAADRIQIRGAALDMAIEAVLTPQRREREITLHCSRTLGG